MNGSDNSAVGRRRIDVHREIRIWWPHPPLVRWVERWRARGRDHHILSGLSDHALRDVGLDRADVDTEGTQSFWRQR